MRKKLIALLLCICMLLPLVTGAIPVVHAEESAGENQSIYHVNIGRQAKINPIYLSGGSVFVSAEPENESTWYAAPKIDGSQISEDLIVEILDVYVSEAYNMYWYKVAVVEGTTVPSQLSEMPWVFQNQLGDSPDYDTLILLDEPSADEPGADEPGADEPGADEPSADEPSADEPGVDEPDAEEPEATEPTAPVWMDYEDFMAAQDQKTFENPALYVDFTAAFNVEVWTTFRYAADPENETPGEEENIIEAGLLMDGLGQSIQVVITDYALDAEGRLWYEVEAADGYELPDILKDNPYILNMEYEEDVASLKIQPLVATFVGETVEILKEPVVATRSVIQQTADLPAFFEVVPVGDWYDLGDITSWSDELAETGYHYVAEASVQLIAPEVTVAFEKLLATRAQEQYDELWNSLSAEIRVSFTQRHLDQLAEHQENLRNAYVTTEVTVGGKTLEVGVQGSIPLDVTLEVAPVSSATVLSEGFDVRSDDIIVALDIKLLKDDGTEWQPENGERIAVSIDMAALGYEDGSIVRLHHKHGGNIDVLDVFIVIDGKATVYTDGLSVFVLDQVTTNTNGATAIEFIDNNRDGVCDTPITLQVGQRKVIYIDITDTVEDSRNRRGTWVVTDTSGAIHYVVHRQTITGNNGNVANEDYKGNNGVYAPWIEIVALKEATNVTLQFKYATITYNNGTGTARNAGSETYNLNITTPKGSKQVYIKDMVNTTGTIFATVVDANGNELTNGLDGARISWTRSDGAYIAPEALVYDENGVNIGVNIAMDHAGLVEARKNDDGTYAPVTYTAHTVLADGTEPKPTYTVYYQSEFINTSFETPKYTATNTNYVFLVNGWPELYWKTTAPGQSGNLTKDIEFGVMNGSTATGFGVTKAHLGTQFAELNAEEVGALYQDIITAPEEKIEWNFAHAPRQKQDWTDNSYNNRMYVIIGATEDAQKLTSQDDLMDIVHAAKAAGISADEPFKIVTVEDEDGKDVEYHVWRDDAGKDSATYNWQTIKGSYIVPPNQYRTRLFFVSDSDDNRAANFGNLIDAAYAGQYKRYLIEYYEERFVEDGSSTTTMTPVRWEEYDETDRALVYSFVDLDNLPTLLAKDYYVHEVKINLNPYPYSVRYKDKDGNEKASLYINKYSRTTLEADPEAKEKYKDYDIVMQVYLRDTIVAVKKIVDLPGEMTTAQQLKLIQKENYEANFELRKVGDENHDTGRTTITSRDPLGGYTGYIAFGEKPETGEDQRYYVEELSDAESVKDMTLEGLELESVTVHTVLYNKGVPIADNQQPKDEIYSGEKLEKILNGTAAATEGLNSSIFELNNDHKIAEVTVTNKYKEKNITIHYVAVGNGKVALTGSTDYQDVPTETLAFYSGKSVGVHVHAGDGATFQGWYRDEACTDEVEDIDGVVDANGMFKPNANVINEEEFTFYAKFTTGSIEIKRTGAEANEVFVYHVVGPKDTNGKQIDFYVTLTCDENGNGSRKILEVIAGEYTITEVGDWSWRYTGTNWKVKHNGEAEVDHTFTGAVKNDYWLSKFSEVVDNVFRGLKQ